MYNLIAWAGHTNAQSIFYLDILLKIMSSIQVSIDLCSFYILKTLSTLIVAGLVYDFIINFIIIVWITSHNIMSYPNRDNCRFFFSKFWVAVFAAGLLGIASWDMTWRATREATLSVGYLTIGTPVKLHQKLFSGYCLGYRFRYSCTCICVLHACILFYVPVTMFSLWLPSEGPFCYSTWCNNDSIVVTWRRRNDPWYGLFDIRTCTCLR